MTRERIREWLKTALTLVAIALVFAAWILYNAVGYLGGHSGADTRIQIKKLEEALVTYASKHRGKFPERLEDAAKYFPEGRVPVDAWGNPFLYLPAAAGEAYVIVSLGADGKPGGVEADADIRSDRPE